jgi:hypothetical protein
MRKIEHSSHSSTVADHEEVFSFLGDPPTFGVTAPMLGPSIDLDQCLHGLSGVRVV